MASKYPPYDNTQDSFLINEIVQWSIGNGLVMLNDAKEGKSAMHAPVTVYPSSYPRDAFEEALAIQTTYNELYISICQERKWLESKLIELSKLDPAFTGRLAAIYNKLRDSPDGFPQKLTGGLFRSDYLLDDHQNQIKQVEFNTVSVSFGGLSTKVGQLHDYLLKTNAYHFKEHKGELQVSESAAKMPDALRKIHQAYGQPDSAVLVIIQPNERNVIDQRLFQFELAKHGISSYRHTLAEVESVISKSADHRLVHNPSGQTISVVYYRAGYAPSDYPSDKEWDARYFLEQSAAIKCPSVFTQLSGSKKIQQLLTDVEEIKKVAPSLNSDQITGLTRTFVNIYALDNPTQETRDLAFKNSSKYVLKPQREGGGNNIYKEDIPRFLETLPEDKWGAYILMELIEPAEAWNKIIRAGEVHHGGVISELGIFGTALWEEFGKDISFNQQASFLLRTKLQESNEGGVAAGFGCIDGIILE